MKTRVATILLFGLIGTCMLAVGLLWPAEEPPRALARRILEDTGVRGGW